MPQIEEFRAYVEKKRFKQKVVYEQKKSENILSSRVSVTRKITDYTQHSEGQAESSIKVVNQTGEFLLEQDSIQSKEKIAPPLPEILTLKRRTYNYPRGRNYPNSMYDNKLLARSLDTDALFKTATDLSSARTSGEFVRSERREKKILLKPASQNRERAHYKHGLPKVNADF